MTGMRCANLPSSQERGKQFAAAESSYRTLLTHFPDDAELHNGLGFGAARAAQVRGSPE